MKFKPVAIGALCLALAATPVTASAHGHHDGGLIFGVLAGTAAVAAAVLTFPFAVAAAAVPQPAYAPPPSYGPPPGYYAPQQAAYAPPQAYYPAPPAYRYYPPQPMYYAPPPYYYGR